MNELIEILKYTIPSIITGAVAAYFLRQTIANENNRRKFEAFNEKKKHSLPIRLQAYERMTLFLERIQPESLCYRVDTGQTNKIEYAKSLIAHINAEFEHNLVQQIYMSPECWDVIIKSKTALMNNITALSLKEHIQTGDDLKNNLLKEQAPSESPIQIALLYVKKEVHQLF